MPDNPRRESRLTCSACGYTVRVTMKWLWWAGAPLCPCSAEPMRPERGDLEVAPPPTPEALVEAAIKRLTAEGRAELADELDGALWAHRWRDHGWRAKPAEATP